MARLKPFWWSALGLMIASVVAVFTIEPMRWSLPARHFFSTLDIHRDGRVDYRLCLRVAMTAEEVERFAVERFEPKDRGNAVAHPPSPIIMICPARFWPEDVISPPMALTYERSAAGDYITGSRGLYYQDGFMHYWSTST